MQLIGVCTLANSTEANYGQTRDNDDNYDSDDDDGDCHFYISDKITMEKRFEK
jgi:hypothetical protein